MKFKYLLVYLVILLLSFFSYDLVFKELNKIPKEQQLDFFISGSIQKHTQKYLLDNLKEENIKQINFHNVSPNDPYYTSLFVTQGILESDIFILPEDFLNTITDFSPFKELDNSYSLKIANPHSLFIFEDDQNYYLLLNKNCHILKVLNLLLN
ncbi:MAG: hypothetical protein LBM99_06425 [Bacillales bacterium]|jgi:hypothetical protein|nr:hypothetical protein [Bacillales bacterium]